MSITVTHVSRSNPLHLGTVYHLSISEEPRESPADESYDAAYLKVDGMGKEEMVELLRKLALSLEAGERVSDIAGMRPPR